MIMIGGFYDVGIFYDNDRGFDDVGIFWQNVDKFKKRSRWSFSTDNLSPLDLQISELEFCVN